MDERPDVTAVCGQTKYGKTCKVCALVKTEPRVLILDTLGHDYSDGIVCYEMAELRRVWLRSYRGRFHMVLRPADPLQVFPDVCDWVLECGQLVFVVEECQLFFSAGVCCPEFTKLITSGSHFGIRLIAVTQSPSRFGKILRAQAHEWIVFGSREPDEVTYLRKRLPGVTEDRIRRLPPHWYIHYRDQWDCYYLCHDDLTMGKTDRKELPYDGAEEAAAADDYASDRGPVVPLDSFGTEDIADTTCSNDPTG
jgi:hypothetical protein